MGFEYIRWTLSTAWPYLAVWVPALVLSSILLKRRGGGLASLLVIGSSMMLLSTLVVSSQPAVFDYIFRSQGTISLPANGGRPGAISRNLHNAATLISVPGIACIFLAVWKKFSEGPQQRNGNPDQGA